MEPDASTRDAGFAFVEMSNMADNGDASQNSLYSGETLKRRLQRQKNYNGLNWLTKSYDEEYDEYLYALDRDSKGTCIQACVFIVLQRCIHTNATRLKGRLNIWVY